MVAHSLEVKLLDPSFIYFQIGGNGFDFFSDAVLHRPVKPMLNYLTHLVVKFDPLGR